jgi:hypothetical protein
MSFILPARGSRQSAGNREGSEQKRWKQTESRNEKGFVAKDQKEGLMAFRRFL